ncbi:MAG: hypothetical protein RL736_53 [Pseudomonadota bacterium]|jgi:hypothetical protein
MPTYENISVEDKNEFDTSDLFFSFTRPIQLCAMEITSLDNNKIIIGSKLKNVALLKEEGVNLQMDAMKNFNYSIRFDGIIVQARVSSDEDKYLAVASVDQLREYLPKNIDLDVNRDLMGVAFDAFVVNRGNKNGHIISTDVALAMVENFINKPFNIEHNRKVVVGVCTGYGFSEFGSSKPLTLEEVKAKKEPFNVVLSGYVWKIVNPEFAADLVDSSDPSSEQYLSVSASWELGFNEFNIAKGSKNLADASIIEDEDKIVELKDRLKVFGGNGSTEDGDIILLNLQGSVLPLGIGFTNTPAAEVSGIAISYDKPAETSAEVTDMKYTCAKCGYNGVKADACPECGCEDYTEMETENENELPASENNINKKSVLTQNNNVKNIMHIKNVDDITDDSMKEVAASHVREFISNKIAELATEWKSKVEEKETALKAAEDQIATLKNDLDAIKADSDKVKEEFVAIQESLKAKEVEATFQHRMAILDEEFDLTDEDRTIIAEDLNTLDSQEAFEKWYKKFSTFAAAKKKSAKVVKQEAMKEGEPAPKEMKEEKAAEIIASEKTVEEVISSVEVKEEVLPNASSPQEATLVEKISAAFNKNSVKINK